MTNSKIELFNFLEKENFKKVNRHIDDKECLLYVRPTKSKFNCELNDKSPQLSVKIYDLSNFIEDVTQIQIEMTGEYKDKWCNPMIYSLNPEELIRSLDNLESTLIKLWETYCENIKE